MWNFYSLAEDTKFSTYNKCGKFIYKGGESAKSYNTLNLALHLRSQHPNKHTELSKLKAKKENKTEIARREE